MGPTNNPAWRSLRPSVTTRKAMHSLKTDDGMSMFGIPLARVMTWRAGGGGQNVCQAFRGLLSGTGLQRGGVGANLLRCAPLLHLID